MGVLEEVCGFTYSYEESKGEKEDTPMDYTRSSGPNEGEELFPHQGKKTEDWDNFRRLRNQVTWCIRKAKQQHFQRLSNQAVGNPRKVWRELNSFLRNGRKRSIL